jgi:glycosyltransferase involved in cell wall biosynthesis
MKVLYLIETLGVGGAEQSLLEILQRFRDVTPTMCHIYEGQDLRPAFEAACIPVVSLDVPPKYRFRTAIRLVEDLVRRERPDLIHTTLFRAEVVGRIVGRRRGIPVVCSFVSECYAEIRWRSLSLPGRAKLKGVQLVDRLTAPLAAHWVANSETVKRSESRSLGISPDRVTVVHRGRDVSRFSAAPTPATSDAYRVSLGLSDGCQVVISVGRLVDSKGHAELIDAFARVASVTPDAVLLLVGDGPERGNLERQVAAAGVADRVRLLGQRADVPQLLAVADVFAFPSHYEGHPGAVVEAMLAGKPIVASDTPVHRETLDDGRCALLVPVRSAVPLADAMLRLLGDPALAAELGARAQELARRRFDIDLTAAQYEALYRRVIAAHDAMRKQTRSSRDNGVHASDAVDFR